MSEKTLFERKNVRITDQNAIFGNKKIPLETITSVTLARESARRRPSWRVLTFGGLLLALGAFLEQLWLLSGGALLIATTLLLSIIRQDRFLLLLGSERGEDRAWVSPHRELMERIASAIHRALVDKP